MVQEQFTIPSVNGNDSLLVSLWQPMTDSPRAIVQIVHGMREHIGRYTDFAAFLASQGYATVGHDQLGHGLSVQKQKLYGYFGAQDGARYLVHDCRNMTRLIKQRFPSVPIFLLGHSMGSFVTRISILHGSEDLQGYICMGTSGEEALAPLGRTIAETLVRMGYGEKPATFLHKLVFSPYERHFSEDKTPNAWLSRDMNSVDNYTQDPHTEAHFTNSGFRDLLELQLASTNKKWAGRVDKSLPILLLSGSQDPVGNFAKGVIQTYERLVLAGVLDVQCKLYDGARHEILNEINREEVFFDILRWMNQRMSSPTVC